MTYYLSGPMSGKPYYNLPAFAKAAATLRDKGFDVISPAELDDDEVTQACLQSPTGTEKVGDQTWGDFLARDIKIVADQCDGVIVMPGWEESNGACLELAVAMMQNKALWQLIEPDKLVPLDPSNASTLIGKRCYASFTE